MALQVIYIFSITLKNKVKIDESCPHVQFTLIERHSLSHWIICFGGFAFV